MNTFVPYKQLHLKARTFHLFLLLHSILLLLGQPHTMLKSTHRPLEPYAPAQDPLPHGWTEHVAPTGHTYYYNAESKQSTYVRPVNLTTSTLHPTQDWSAEFSRHVSQTNHETSGRLPTNNYAHSFSSNGRSYENIDRKLHSPEDRPKSKHPIPGCAPWLLIKTKLARRFVYNPDTNESFWKFPKDIIGGVVEYDIEERKRKERLETTHPSVAFSEKEESAKVGAGELALPTPATPYGEKVDDKHSGGDEYEEVEVTDDEDVDSESLSKRQKTDHTSEHDEQPVEFGEDDIAYQLAQMGETYQLDPGKYPQDVEGNSGEIWEEGAGDLPQTIAEGNASFYELLNDYHINPFSTWETIIADGQIVADDRYTLLPNMKSRKEVFAEWSMAKIEQIKLQRQNQEKKDPRIPFLSFLQQHATPKLYWSEFRRKFKREPEIKGVGLNDKEREKLYREHINRITKVPESTLKSDLEALLDTIPPSASWNRLASIDDTLPSALLADVRYISLKPDVRDPLIKAYIDRLL